MRVKVFDETEFLRGLHKLANVIAAGLVLDTVSRGRREMKLLAYLSHRAPGEERRRQD